MLVIGLFFSLKGLSNDNKNLKASNNSLRERVSVAESGRQKSLQETKELSTKLDMLKSKQLEAEESIAARKQQVEEEYKASVEWVSKQYEELVEKKETLFSEQKDRIVGFLSDKTKAYRWLAGMMADYLTLAEDEYVMKLMDSRSASKHEKAVKINDLRREKRRLIEENKILKYELSHIKAIYPDAEEFIEYDEMGIDVSSDDFITNFISKEEYDKLSETEKNKRALNYYLNRKKTNWEIGRDFERYVGYLYEKSGAKVEYFGIEKKMNDLGRDLIVERKDGTIDIVQCKYWARDKQIHEKHIAQLFGTLTKYKLDHPDEKRPVYGVFATHTTLSDEAKRFADALNIVYQENIELREYPLIKCHNGKNPSGERTKIYHIPIDQQYDTTIIDPENGDFWAMTIEEAEAAGYRRAWKWHPSA